MPVTAGAAPTIVTFEDLSHANTGQAWTRLTSHRGVGFGDGVTAIDYSQPGYQVSGFSTHSGTVGIEELPRCGRAAAAPTSSIAAERARRPGC